MTTFYDFFTFFDWDKKFFTLILHYRDCHEQCLELRQTTSGAVAALWMHGSPEENKESSKAGNKRCINVKDETSSSMCLKKIIALHDGLTQL